MISFSRFVCAGVAGLLTISVQAKAQAELSDHLASAHVITSATQTTSSPLQRSIHVEFENVKIADAVAQIAERGGVRLSYRSSVLGDKTVSFSAEKIAVSAAFARVLAGTGLRVASGPNGVFLLVRDDRQPQADGIVIGKVISEKTKQPIAGARIIVGEQGSVATTGEDGTFRLTLKPGEHRVSVRAVGFTRQERQVVVESEKTQTIEIVLEPSASVLDEVIVTGTVVETERKALPTPITVITAEDIEKRGITRIEQLLRGEVPGVYAMDMGTQAYTESSFQLGKNVESAVFGRGASSLTGSANPLKTFIDGVEMVDPAYLGTIDPSAIDRIEILVGPQAATIYGSDAMGGVMQIFTKKGHGAKTVEARLRLQYGILESNFSQGLTPSHNHNLDITGGTGAEFSWAGNLSYRYTGQWQPSLFTRSTGASIGLTYIRGPLTATGSASVNLTQNGTMNSNPGSIPCGYSSSGGCVATPYRYQLIASGQDVAGSTVVGAIFSQRIANSSAQTYAWNANYRVNPIWGHQITIGRSYNQLSRVPDRPLYARASGGTDTLWQTARDEGKRTTWGYNTTITPRWNWVTSSLTLGTNGAWGDRLQIQGCLTYPESTTYVGCGSFVSQPVSNTFSSWGGFGSWQLGLWDRLFLTLGLRGERNPNYGRNHTWDWTPTNGLSYVMELHDVTVKLLGSYGRSTRPPDPEQRREIIEHLSCCDIQSYIRQVESPQLRPEFSRGPQGGIEIYYKNIGSISVNHYVQTVDDLIQSIGVDSVIATWLSFPQKDVYHVLKYINAAQVRNKGWEGTASLNLWRLSLSSTYSWTDSRVLSVHPEARVGARYTSPYSGLQPGQLFTYTPTHTASIVASYAWGGTSATLTYNWRGASLQQADSEFEFMRASYGRLPMYGLSKRVSGPQVAITSRGRSNFVMSQRLNPWASATLNIVNVGNDSQSDAGIWWPTLGRQTSIGVTLRYPNR